MKTLKILTIVAVFGLAAVVGIMAYTNVDNTENENNLEQETSNNSSIEKPPVKSSGYDIGDIATDFRLKNIDDTMMSLTDFPDADGYIVIFTCNHCPYSVAYEDRIIALDKEFKTQGYPVIAINPNNPKAYPEDSFENMKKRAAAKGFTFPYLFDDGQKIYPQYGATKTPHVFLLKKEDGENIVKYIGAIDDNHKDATAIKNDYLRDAVNALIANKPIEKTKTVAIGCSIKP